MSDNLPNPSGAGVPAVPEQSLQATPYNRKIFNPNAMTPEERGRFFDVVEERQDDVDGILGSDKDPEWRSRELNQLINGVWDDEQGLTYIHILGEQLPDLQIHGQAKGLVISASQLDRPNFEGANLEAAVFSMSVLKNLRARGANLNMALMPLAHISGDLTDIQAVDANFNLAQLKVRAKRANFANAFLLATLGLTDENAREAYFAQATMLGEAEEHIKRSPRDILQRRLSSGFIDSMGSEDRLKPRIAKVHKGISARYALEAGRDAEGQLWYDGDLSRSRMPDFNLIASILGDVNLSNSNGNTMRAPGLITVDGSNLNGLKARGSWMPGSVHIGTQMNNMDITESHMPGMVMVEPQLSGIVAQDANLDGTVIVLEDPEKARELEEQVKTRVKVIIPRDLAESVQQITNRARALNTGSKSARELQA